MAIKIILRSSLDMVEAALAGQAGSNRNVGIFDLSSGVICNL
jgi:hypothetical protein